MEAIVTKQPILVAHSSLWAVGNAAGLTTLVTNIIVAEEYRLDKGILLGMGSADDW